MSRLRSRPIASRWLTLLGEQALRLALLRRQRARPAVIVGGTVRLCEPSEFSSRCSRSLHSRIGPVRGAELAARVGAGVDALGGCLRGGGRRQPHGRGQPQRGSKGRGTHRHVAHSDSVTFPVGLPHARSERSRAGSACFAKYCSKSASVAIEATFNPKRSWTNCTADQGASRPSSVAFSCRSSAIATAAGDSAGSRDHRDRLAHRRAGRDHVVDDENAAATPSRRQACRLRRGPWLPCGCRRRARCARVAPARSRPRPRA